MDLKERIQMLCKSIGITAEKLENDLDYGKGYISKLGKSKPNSRKLQEIADYFGVSLDFLMNGENSEFSSKQALLDLKISQDLELKVAIEKYYSLSDKKKKHVIELIELLAEGE